jgi:OmpA-OmpF porin, OOP family
MKYLTLLSLFACLSLPAFAESSLRESLRIQVFDKAQQALGAANEAGASILAPETYRSAAQAYKNGEEAFDSGADLDRVQRYMDEARAEFTRAATLAATVKEFVADPYQARLDALGAEAKTRAPKLWEKAELQFYEATSRAELGRENRVERFAKKAESLYREAELAAIETALFNEIEKEISVAKELDADDWAPNSYDSALVLLKQAREELAANRYDTDRPRDIAKQALHHAKHAQYVARLADDIDDNDTSLEAVLETWETSIKQLATDLDQAVYFDQGPEEAIGLLRKEVAARAATQASTADQLSDSERRARRLEEELLVVQVALEGEEKAKALLDQRVAADEERAAKFRRIEGLFTDNEAQILREQDKLILRLVGLSFTSGSSTLETKHYPVLTKLIQALQSFPDVPVTIEGHTDSHGVDAANLQLSVARAENVTSYLLANSDLEPGQISSLGYGETRPIANNETVEGRARNRRIDVVLYP